MNHIHVGTWVARIAARTPAKTAIVCDDERISYAELAARVAQGHDALASAGLRRGDRVACVLGNGVDLVELALACAAGGFIAVPINWRLRPDEVHAILADCEPQVVVADQRLEAGAAALAWDGAGLRLGWPDAYRAFRARGDGARPASDEVEPDDVHVLLYTSGTTGRPKGVMLTHANTHWQSVNAWALGASPDAVGLVVLPLFHAGGLNGSVTPLLHLGATLVIPARFDVGETLALIEAEGVTGMVAVPTIYALMAEHPGFGRHDLSSLQTCVSGGAPLEAALVATYAARGVALCQGYGLTETAPGATGMAPGRHLEKAGTVGLPCLYTDVAVVDAGDRPVPTGEVGEVVVRGPNVMAGYWRRPEETARALRGGWFHTGDLGVFDADGYLRLVGRSKDLIISGGENIVPAEVEAVLAAVAGVRECAVVGVPDPRWGEVPAAFVATGDAGVDPAALRDALRARCEAQLGRFKHPKQIHLVAALPRNALGKVERNTLRAWAADGTSGDVAATAIAAASVENARHPSTSTST